VRVRVSMGLRLRLRLRLRRTFENRPCAVLGAALLMLALMGGLDGTAKVVTGNACRNSLGGIGFFIRKTRTWGRDCAVFETV
jgi:hypothetical protein